MVEDTAEVRDCWALSSRHSIDIVKVVLLDVEEDAADDVHAGTLVANVGLRNIRRAHFAETGIFVYVAGGKCVRCT